MLQEIKRMQLDDSDKEDADEMEVSDDEGHVPKITSKTSKKSSANEALKVLFLIVLYILCFLFIS